jgi:hypothetical protein
MLAVLAFCIADRPILDRGSTPWSFSCFHTATFQSGCMAGPGNDPVQVFATLRDLHWEFLRLWTGFELPSSCLKAPCYALNRNRNILDFMRWPQIDLGAQDINGIQRPKSFQKIAGSKVLDEYYNTYLIK